MSDDERTPAKAAVGGAGTESVSGKKRSRSAIQGPLAPIATPLADKKLCKHVLKVVKKAAAAKVLRRGVKEVVKAVRKGESGLMAIAGDIAPIDVISHLPVLCEDHSIPYVFVPSKADLGAAANTKRPTSVVLVASTKRSKATGGREKVDFDGADKLEEVVEEVKGLAEGKPAAAGAAAGGDDE